MNVRGKERVIGDPPELTNAPSDSAIQAIEHGFPIKLSDFEDYSFRDESEDYPMVMYLLTHIEGDLDVRLFQQAIAEVLEYHPLLRSTVDTSRWMTRWRLSETLRPQLDIRQFDQEHPPTSCAARRIDLEKEVGANFELRKCPKRSLLVSCFHHACVDGIGAMKFLANVFSVYAQQTSESEQSRPIIRFPSSHALKHRGDIDLQESGFKRRTPVRVQLRETYRLLMRPCYTVRGNEDSSATAATVRNVLRTHVLPRSVLRGLKQMGRLRNVSINDLFLAAYLQQLVESTNSSSDARPSDVFRVLIPVSMRTPRHDEISAANVLSYVFHQYRRDDIGDPDALLSAIARRTREAINQNEGSIMLKGLRTTRRIPGLFRLTQKIQPTYATAVLANVGEVRRMFDSSFPLKKGRVVAGNVVIQRIDGIGPIRKNTNLAISFGLYGGELVINLRQNPAAISDAEAQEFFERLLTRLTEMSGTQEFERDASFNARVDASRT